MSELQNRTRYDVYHAFGKMIVQATHRNNSVEVQKIDLMLKNEILLKLSELVEIADAERKNV